MREKTYLCVRAKVRTIGLCYFCPDHEDCSGKVHIVFGARGQERNGTSIGKTGNRLMAGGTENRSSSLFVHSCDPGCTKFILFNRICPELFSFSWSVYVWWKMLVPSSFLRTVLLWLRLVVDVFLLLPVRFTLLDRCLRFPLPVWPCSLLRAFPLTVFAASIARAFAASLMFFPVRISLRKSDPLCMATSPRILAPFLARGATARTPFFKSGKAALDILRNMPPRPYPV